MIYVLLLIFDNQSLSNHQGPCHVKPHGHKTSKLDALCYTVVSYLNTCRPMWHRFSFNSHCISSEKCFTETCNCCVMHYAHSVWPISKDKDQAWMHKVQPPPPPHTHTHTCKHAHRDSLWGPESCHIVESYEKFRLKNFLVSFWPQHLKQKRENNNDNNDNNNNNTNGCSYIKRIGRTAKTLQSLKPPYHHQQNPRQQLHHHNDHQKRQLWQLQQHSNNNKED